VTYAKKEEKREIKGNVAAAKARMTFKKSATWIREKRDKGKKPNKRSAGSAAQSGVVEGNRAARPSSGASGFKISKKRGKMRLFENK